MFLFVSGSSQSQRADFYDIDFLSIRRRLATLTCRVSSDIIKFMTLP